MARAGRPPVTVGRMTSEGPRVDALIVGGGIAGLWVLDALARRGMSAVVVEPFALGAGQTLWSQGIIHGGTKYSLSGLLSGSAEAIREMPAIWRACLSGERQPDLSAAKVRSRHCFLWQTTSARSTLGMLGARIGLRNTPVVLAPQERPALLRSCPGTVARLDEQVVDPGSVLAALARQHASSILRVDSPEAIEVRMARGGRIESVQVSRPGGGPTIGLRPRVLVLSAGEGNESWRMRLDLPKGKEQTRPLHMVMLRGSADALPPLFGHCIDGARTRVTVTSAEDSRGRTLWQIGGEVAEVGVGLTPEALTRHARSELQAVIPGLQTRGCEWSTYVAPRAESAMPGGKRPDDAVAIREGDVITAWPTKLALAPRLGEVVADLVSPGSRERFDPAPFADWPRPVVASPPWATAQQWRPDAAF